MSKSEATAYRRNHGWDPPSPLLDLKASELFLGEDLIPSAAFLVPRGETLAADGSLRLGGAQGAVDLGWACVADQYQADAADLTAALVARCLAGASQRGWMVQIEVDQSDDVLWRVLHEYPVSWKPDGLTYACTTHGNGANEPRTVIAADPHRGSDGSWGG
ncbi:MAG: hypothetical protein ACRDJW_12670 [Thermomicrobiales bacterium]